MGIIFDVTTKKVDAGVDINARYGRKLDIDGCELAAQAD
jgi:hypothetical protein